MTTAYPRRIPSTHPRVHAELLGTQYLVYFPYSIRAKETAQIVLRNPTFDPDHKAWAIKQRWHRSLPGMLEAIAETVRAVEADAETARAAAQERANAAGRKAIATSALVLDGHVTIAGDKLLLKSPYHPQIHALCKPLADRFDSAARQWQLPLSAGTQLAASTEQLIAWLAEAHASRRQRTRTPGSRPRRPGTDTPRYLEHACHAPSSGVAVTYRGAQAIVENAGRVFACPQVLAQRHTGFAAGDRVCYVYLRTPAASGAADSSPET